MSTFVDILINLWTFQDKLDIRDISRYFWTFRCRHLWTWKFLALFWFFSRWQFFCNRIKSESCEVKQSHLLSSLGIILKLPNSQINLLFGRVNPCGDNFFCDPAGISATKMVSWAICSPEQPGLRKSLNLGANERGNPPLFSGHVEMSANVHIF